MDCRPFPPRQEDEEAAQNSSLMSYLKTKRIEAPIVVHFVFNLTHFVFFSS
jgi:hypothetical protein